MLAKNERIQESIRRLNEMAVQAEAELRSKHPTLLSQFNDELERQKAGFSYEFRRHGDFMTVSLTRSGNQSSEWREAATQFVETINLSLVRSIRFSAGRAADENGRFGWVWNQVHRNEKGEICGSGSGSGSGFPLWPWDGEYRVTPWDSPTYVPTCRDYVRKSGEGTYDHYDICGSWDNPHRTSNFPQESKDDEIYLAGLDMAILAPYGCGSAMHEAMLAEIERGTPRT